VHQGTDTQPTIFCLPLVEGGFASVLARDWRNRQTRFCFPQYVLRMTLSEHCDRINGAAKDLTIPLPTGILMFESIRVRNNSKLG